MTLIAPIFLISLAYNKLMGIIVLGGIIGTGMVLTFVKTLTNHAPPTLLAYSIPDLDLSNVYNKPYVRMASYGMGLLGGWVLMASNRRLRIPPFINSILILLSSFIIYVLWIWWPQRWVQMDGAAPRAIYTGLEAATYASLSGALWSAAWTYIIVACTTGNASPLDRLLSWRGFLPFSRLNYQAYVSHLLIVSHYVGSARVPIHLSYFFLVSWRHPNEPFDVVCYWSYRTPNHLVPSTPYRHPL